MGITYCTNDDGKVAENIRPSESHISGNLAAQQLCDKCAQQYDKRMADHQSSFREQRKKDLEKKRHS